MSASEPLLSLVVPTIAGREELLSQTREALREVIREDFGSGADVELITPEDYPCIGEAWNAGAAQAVGRYLWLGADDVILATGSLSAAIEAVDRGIYPSPRILTADGAIHSCGTMGQGALMGECATDTACVSSPFPMIERDMWARIGPCIPTHYYADDYLAWSATNNGLVVRVIREYEMTHLDGTVGIRAMHYRARDDMELWINSVSTDSQWPLLKVKV